MNRIFALGTVLLLAAAMAAQAQDPAVRSITGTVVAIDVTPPVPPPGGWAFWTATETLAESLTPSNITGPNPVWNAAVHTITWSSATIAPATLGYEVSGECDIRTVSGEIVFVDQLAEESIATTTGDTLITGLDPDTTPPVITLLGDPAPCYTNVITNIMVQLGDPYVDAGASAYDACDGDITASIVTTNNVNTNEVGSYHVTYNVLDSAGNAATEVMRMVNVVDGMGPYVVEVDVVSNNSIKVVFSKTMGTCADIPTYYTISGTGIGTFPPHPTSVTGGDATWYLTWDECAIMLAGGNITVTVAPDMTDSVGFPITMPNYGTDIGGAMAPPPVITLLGDNPATVEIGAPYMDAGATALDQCGNDISAAITVIDMVNTGILGAYTVTYNVADAAGNMAYEVTRTVNVIAEQPSVPVAGGPSMAAFAAAVALCGGAALLRRRK